MLLLITAGIAIITFLLCQMVVLKPFRARKTVLRAQLQRINEGGSVARLSQQVDELEKSLPPQKDPSWLLARMTELAQQSQLDIKSMEPLPEKALPPYSYTAVNITTICTFSQLLQFLHLVEAGPYIFNIENLNVSLQKQDSSQSKKDEPEQKAFVSTEITIGTVHLTQQ